MNRLRPSAFEAELARRLAVLSRGEGGHRRLPASDMAALAAITVGAFVLVLLAQAF